LPSLNRYKGLYDASLATPAIGRPTGTTERPARRAPHRQVRVVILV